MQTPTSPVLFILSGLPGTGKTTLGRQIATAFSAAYIRIDTLEQALVDAGLVKYQWDLGPSGYMAAYALASDNLQIGISVVADSVNPLQITRDAWRHVAIAQGADYLEIEVICSDIALHRQRVENRVSDIPGLLLPDWQSVMDRTYEAWDRAHIIIDTTKLQPEEAVREILAKLGEGREFMR